MQLRDQQRLAKIKEYCEDIQTSMDSFDHSFSMFCENNIYQFSVAFCLLQIGELVGKLTEEYRAVTRTQISWPQIKGLRNVIVHDYGSIDLEGIWRTITTSIPELHRFCCEQLRESEQE